MSAQICEPDPRSQGFSKLDLTSGQMRAKQLEDYYDAVSHYTLHSGVPDRIAAVFDTGRNLYLYAWFVYRFHMVAVHHTVACLELALRERYKDEIGKEYYPRSKFPTLAPLLRFALDRGDLRNEGFARWHQSAELNATERYETEKLRELIDSGLEEIELDYTEVRVADEDTDPVYVGELIQRLPKLRNIFAHGTAAVSNQGISTIETVAEIINQIYPDPGH